jgi:hypothetical protein
MWYDHIMLTLSLKAREKRVLHDFDRALPNFLGLRDMHFRSKVLAPCETGTPPLNVWWMWEIVRT